MGLFVNQENHPEVYTNKTDILEQNQGISTIDPLSEWIREQKEANHALYQQLNKLQSLVEQQEVSQSDQLRIIRNRLNGLQEIGWRQEQFENEVIESFVQLHAENHTFQHKLAEERAFNQTVAKQVNDVSQSTIEIAVRLEEFNSLNQEIALEVQEQHNHQKQLSEQLGKQEEIQLAVISRLEKQEGLTEKLLKQVDHLRSVLYERTNLVAEKIEGGYQTTSQFITKLLTSPDQLTTRFMVNQKQDEKKENSE